jgi:hypothetical protein
MLRIGALCDCHVGPAQQAAQEVARFGPGLASLEDVGQRRDGMPIQPSFVLAATARKYLCGRRFARPLESDIQQTLMSSNKRMVRCAS